MYSNDTKIIATFSVGGLTSGLLTVLMSEVTGWVMWFGVGVLFALALFISMHYANRNDWLTVQAPLRSYWIAAVILVVIYPLAFLLSLEIAFAYDWLYEMLLRARLGRDTSPDEGILIGLAFAAMVSALALSLAMRMLTGKWNRKITILMIVGGVTTVPLAWLASKIFSNLDDFWPHWLLIFGQTLFAALAGYWFAMTNQADVAERSERSTFNMWPAEQ